MATSLCAVDGAVMCSGGKEKEKIGKKDSNDQEGQRVTKAMMRLEPGFCWFAAV